MIIYSHSSLTPKDEEVGSGERIFKVLWPGPTKEKANEGDF